MSEPQVPQELFPPAKRPLSGCVLFLVKLKARHGDKRFSLGPDCHKLIPGWSPRESCEGLGERQAHLLLILSALLRGHMLWLAKHSASCETGMLSRGPETAWSGCEAFTLVAPSQRARGDGQPPGGARGDHAPVTSQAGSACLPRSEICWKHCSKVISVTPALIFPQGCGRAGEASYCIATPSTV